MTLPSDASLTIYPENKIGNYTVDLGPPIDLSQGNWEVALLDINYPTKWNNVLDRDDMKITVHVPGSHICKLGISPGSYTTKSFVLALGNECRSMWRSKHMHFRRASMTKQGRFVLWTNTITSGRRAELIFTKPLANVLGVFGFSPINRGAPEDGSFLMWDNVIPKHVAQEMRAKATTREKEEVKLKYNRWFNVPDETNLGFQIKHQPKQCADRFIFPHRIDPNINFRHFTVETNVIEADALGQRDLRVFVPESMSEKPEIVHKEFTTPHFKPLAKGLESLKTINIKILDELRRPVMFTGGKASVTLCLRRRQ